MKGRVIEREIGRKSWREREREREREKERRLVDPGGRNQRSLWHMAYDESYCEKLWAGPEGPNVSRWKKWPPALFTPSHLIQFLKPEKRINILAFSSGGCQPISWPDKPRLPDLPDQPPFMVITANESWRNKETMSSKYLADLDPLKREPIEKLGPLSSLAKKTSKLTLLWYSWQFRLPMLTQMPSISKSQHLNVSSSGINSFTKITV